MVPSIIISNRALRDKGTAARIIFENQISTPVIAPIILKNEKHCRYYDSTCRAHIKVAKYDTVLVCICRSPSSFFFYMNPTVSRSAVAWVEERDEREHKFIYEYDQRTLSV